METKYDVFISYSRNDYVKNDVIIPGNPISTIQELFDKNSVSYWIDKDGIYSGQQFLEIISKAISNSKMLVFVSSVHSNASIWTTGEIFEALDGKKLIIPVRIDDCPYNEKFRMLVRPLDYIDYQSRSKTALARLLRAVIKEKERIMKAEEVGDTGVDKINVIGSVKLPHELSEQIGIVCLENKDFRGAELHFEAGESNYWLGIMEYEGLGRKKSYKKAYDLFSKQRSDARCCLMMALMQFRGEGVRKNDEKALKIIKKIKEDGNDNLCAQKAQMIENIINDTADETTINKVYSTKFHKI